MDSTSNLFQTNKRALVALLFQAGLRHVLVTGRWHQKLRCTFYFERCETLDLVLASTSEIELERLERFAAALEVYRQQRGAVRRRLRVSGPAR